MTNEEKFRVAYLRYLTAAVQRNPQDYQWQKDVTAEIVVDRMIASIKRKGFVMSSAIRSAARECGVTPPTITNISDYVNGKLSIINAD